MNFSDFFANLFYNSTKVTVVSLIRTSVNVRLVNLNSSVHSTRLIFGRLSGGGAAGSVSHTAATPGLAPTVPSVDRGPCGDSLGGALGDDTADDDIDDAADVEALSSEL